MSIFFQIRKIYTHFIIIKSKKLKKNINSDELFQLNLKH